MQVNITVITLVFWSTPRLVDRVLVTEDKSNFTDHPILSLATTMGMDIKFRITEN
jgi:hypothetical protein